MNTFHRRTGGRTGGLIRTLGVGAALALSVAAARADDPVTMAPPVQPEASQPYDDQAGGYYDSQSGEPVPVDGAAGASRDSVFRWQEIPQNQRVPLTRAVFDRGGYQLFDTVGETIVVPFTNQNLYVMRFGQSPDGTTYFVNESGVPTLYLPRDGYLENASAEGARWYPFPKSYHYVQPVFLGIAPSWPEYVDMGWYPHMAFYGGFYSHTSFVEGGVFLPMFGLSIFIGGRPYHDWDGYRGYYDRHPAPYHLTVVNNYYDRGRGNDHAYFYGTGRRHPIERGSGGDRAYGGRTFGGDRAYGGNRTFGGGDANFRGRGQGGDSGGHASYNHRTFQGANGGSFGGGRSYGNGGGQPAYSGGTHSFSGGRSWGGGQSSSGGGRSYTTGSGRSYSSGGGRSSGGGGGRSSGGGRSNSGGGRSSDSRSGGGRFSGGDRGRGR